MWLAIETASSYLGVALWQPEANLLIKKGEMLGRGMSARLHPLLAELLGEAGASPAALQGIIVNRGPGSFTSIRLGLAAAQGLALPYQTPIYAIDAFTLQAQPFLGQSQPVVVWLAAKEHEVYTQTFAPDGQIISPGACLTYPQALAALPSPCLLCGNGVSWGFDYPAGVTLAEQTQGEAARIPDVAWLVQQGPRLAADPRAHDLSPWYIKPLAYRTLSQCAPESNLGQQAVSE